MKRYALVFLLGLFLSCKKDKTDPEIPSGALFEITLKGKLHSKLEYNNGKVNRLAAYSSCDTPYSISEFGYSGDRITSIRTGNRSLWSSWSGALCDPNGTFEYQNYTVEYDSQGRQSKATGKNLTALFEYNGLNARVSVKYHTENSTRVDLFKFDKNGNVTERGNEAPNSVGPSRYEYDDHPNPYVGLNTSIWPDPFTCPNNVVRAYDYAGDLQWERKFTYDAAGRPLTCEESTGAIYEYHYR